MSGATASRVGSPSVDAYLCRKHSNQIWKRLLTERLLITA